MPYYYSAYQHGSVSINSKASPSSKAALWDFFVYANVESLDVVSQKKGPTYLDPFRRSQLDISAKDYWTPPWSERDYDDMRMITLWAGQSPNVALPLRRRGPRTGRRRTRICARRGIDSGVGRPRLNGWPPSSTPASVAGVCRTGQ